MKLYSLRFRDIQNGMPIGEPLGLFLSLKAAKEYFPTANMEWFYQDLISHTRWVGNGKNIFLVINEVFTKDEPDFATLAGEAFYATSE